MSKNKSNKQLTDEQRKLMWQKLLIAKEIKIRKARESFWEYCKAVQPDFFKDSRWHLKKMADTLQALVENKLINPKTNKPYDNLMINLPPRHGKSFTVQLFAQWILGKNPKKQFIDVSYGKDLSIRFSQNIRDAISQDKGKDLYITFSDVFPDVKLKHGDSSKQAWSLEGSQVPNFYATSIGGAITGMGATVGVIDDPVKNHEEAFNEQVLQEIFDWYNNTFLSRIEKGGKRIIIMTRWSTKDLVGRLLEREPEEWYELKLPACLNEETGEMLCDELFDFEMYKKAKESMSEEIFMANYQQEPMDIKGRLYTKLLTYEDKPIPRDESGHPLFEKIIAYTDTADKGEDNFVSIVGGVYKGQIWVLDILYTKAPMEETEMAQVDLLMRNKVNIVKIESNNGGGYFARNVEKRMHEKGYRFTKVESFHQSKNKVTRILVNSSYVMNNIFFPTDWKDKYRRFYQDLMSYQKEGRNKHDDAPDALTGLAEMVHDATPKLIPVPRIY